MLAWIKAWRERRRQLAADIEYVKEVLLSDLIAAQRQVVCDMEEEPPGAIVMAVVKRTEEKLDEYRERYRIGEPEKNGPARVSWKALDGEIMINVYAKLEIVSESRTRLELWCTASSPVRQSILPGW